jgi:hypothetical protein
MYAKLITHIPFQTPCHNAATTSALLLLDKCEVQEVWSVYIVCTTMGTWVQS